MEKVKEIKKMAAIYIEFADFVVLGIIAVCLVLIGLNELFNPANIIERAIDKSVCEYSARETANTPFLNTDALDMAETDSATVNIDFNITDGSLKNGGVEFTLDRDAAAKTAQANFNLNYSGTAALAINAYADNENVVVAAPALYDKNISIGIDEFSKRIYDTAGIVYDETQPQNIIFDAQAQNNTYTALQKGIVKGFQSSGRKAWRKISNKVQLSSMSSEQRGDNDKGYELIISAEDINTFYTVFGEELFSNTDFKNGLTAYAEKEFNSNPYMYMMYGISDPQVLADNLNASFKNIYAQLTGTGEDNQLGLEAGDVTIFIYINDGMVVNSQIGTFFTAQGQQLDVNLNADLTGESNPADNLNVELSALSEGAGYTVIFSDKNSFESNQYTTTKNITVDDTFSTSTIDLSTVYNKENGHFSAGFSMGYDDTNVVEYSSEGTIQSDSKNYIINADSINAIADGETVLRGEGTFRVVPLENEITPIEGEAVDLLNTEEDELNSIAEEIQNKLTEILSKFLG